MLKSAWLLAVVVGLAVLVAASPNSPRELRALKAALKKQQRAKELRTATSAKASAAGSGEYVPDAGPWSGENEPSCEQLREMWRQSKRRSRAAEATNEIPQYADPFARAATPYGAQWATLVGEPTLRPRPERRPVVYGRPLRHPPADDGERSPLETLRREALQEHDAAAFRLAGADPSAGVVLNSEDERSPFAKSPAKGQFNNLRDFVRQEGVVSAGGGYERLRDVVRQEKAARSRGDWTDTDVGRVVMSPSELGGKQASLYGMQSDAPYEGHSHGRRPTSGNANRLAAFFGGAQKGATTLRAGKIPSDDDASDGRARAFQLREPPRQRVNGHRLPGRARLTASAIDPDDQGVVRGYVVGRNSNPFYSRPSRRSSPTVEEYEPTETCGLESDGVCRRNADCRCLARLFGPQSGLLTAAKCRRVRCLASKSSARADSKRDRGLLAADDVEQEAAGQEDAAAADVSQLIRALRLDADGGDDSMTDDADKSN